MCWLLLTVCPAWSAETCRVYLGTGGGAAEGIYSADFNPDRGRLSNLQLAAEVDAPGFLAMHPDGKTLYAVAQGSEGQGSVVAYRIQADGSLSQLNEAVIQGGRAAHVSVHPSGEFLLTAQYGAGSVAVFPLQDSGALEPASQYLHHDGASQVDARRQRAPHPHWVGFAPDGRFAFVPDLGKDAIVVYRVDLAAYQLAPHLELVAPPGSGPRHMRFSVDGRFIYLLNELSLSVRTFAYAADLGRAEVVSDTSALSAEIQAGESMNSASELVVHPSGDFVYSANRGHDSVTAYRVCSDSGDLTVLEVESIRGSWPRNIQLDRSGQWLLAAGARSDTISVFRVDAETGLLQFRQGPVFHAPNVICMVFAE